MALSTGSLPNVGAEGEFLRPPHNRKVGESQAAHVGHSGSAGVTTRCEIWIRRFWIQSRPRSWGWVLLQLAVGVCLICLAIVLLTS